MTPARTNKRRGNFELDRVFPDVGRIRRSSETPLLREYHRRDAILTKLYETGQLEVLRAFRDGRLAMAQLVEHDRVGGPLATLEVLLLRRPLAEAVRETLPLMGKTANGRARFALSLKQLQERAGFGAGATVADLRRVDWRTLRTAWPGSPADWNRMRSAVSRFLTLVTGDVYSPFRREIVKAIPRADEPMGRTPDLTPAQFLTVVERAPDAVRAALMVLVLTGMRVGEYLACDTEHLRQSAHQIRVPGGEGSKTGPRLIGVAPEDWRWIEAGVPFEKRPPPAVRVPVHFDSRYKRLRRAWADACRAAGLDGIRLHDLRHCAAQWASDAGASGGAISDLLGHLDSKTARRYERMKAAARASGLIGAQLRVVGGGSA